MGSPFLTCDGFFVCWQTKSGQCRIFTKSKDQANSLFVSLKKTIDQVEKYKVENGKMKKIA